MARTTTTKGNPTSRAKTAEQEHGQEQEQPHQEEKRASKTQQDKEEQENEKKIQEHEEHAKQEHRETIIGRIKIRRTLVFSATSAELSPSDPKPTRLSE